MPVPGPRVGPCRHPDPTCARVPGRRQPQPRRAAAAPGLAAAVPHLALVHVGERRGSAGELLRQAMGDEGKTDDLLQLILLLLTFQCQ